MRCCIFGAGGVGGYLGARLAEAGHEVHLIARGDHLTAIQRNGLRLESVFGDTTVEIPATDDPKEVGPCDVVVFTVKTYDTVASAGQLVPLLHDETAVISFQNGVDNEHLIAETIGPEHPVCGVAKIFSTIAAPGVVRHTGGPAEFIYGEMDGSVSERMRVFDGAMADCTGIQHHLSEEINVELWRKLAFICAQSGMTAATRSTIGDIRTTDATWRMYRRVIEEVVEVARAKAIDLPAGTVGSLIEFATTLDAEMTSSLAYDLEHSNRLELEALCGSVVRHGRANDIETPMNEALFGVLAPWIDGR